MATVSAHAVGIRPVSHAAATDPAVMKMSSRKLAFSHAYRASVVTEIRRPDPE